MSNYRIIRGRVERFCKHYRGQKFHALLCDPPYNLAFMGKDWDKGGIAFKPETWAALAEHLLPGAFGMTFASSRGWHRVACAIEDAGLRLHPTIFCWAFGSGFPKASRIGKVAREPQPDKGTVDAGEWANVLPELQKRAEEERQAIREKARRGDPFASTFVGHRYGLQALKPAVEPIIVFQKPYEGKPVDSIVKHGAGALNIEAGRLGTDKQHKDKCESVVGLDSNRHGSCYGDWKGERESSWSEGGRWPANFALQHHPDCRRVGVKKVKVPKHRNPSDGDSKFPHGDEMTRPDRGGYDQTDADGLETVEEWRCVESCPVRKLDEQSGERKTTWISKKHENARTGEFMGTLGHPGEQGYNDSGGASRFFFNSDWNAEAEEGILSADPVNYCAKAARKERDAGLGEEFPEGEPQGSKRSKPAPGRKRALGRPRRNTHPTVKPIKLCRWLARLLLPPEQYAPRRLLVPFAGVGSEMIAAALEGWEVLGIEAEAGYVEIAKARLSYWLSQGKQGALWPK